MEFLTNQYVLLTLTFGIYAGAQMLQRRTGVQMLNPILLTVVVMICLLMLCGVGYEQYQPAGQYIEFWLKPAVVALAVPLYKQLEAIRKQMLPLIVAEVGGCVAGIVSVVLVAKLLGASREVVLSLAAKSVTTPVAIEVTHALGGIEPLTAAVVICTGIFGGITGFKFMRLARVKSPMAQSLSMGTAAHAVGTSVALVNGQRYGGFSSLGLTINGLLTSLLAPYILAALGY
jgi:predicted murein hydrolase (TIGR00659 family)